MAGNNLKYRELILILISENKVLYKLFNQNEKYHSLLKELIKYDLDEDELPSQKELLNTLGISRSKLIRCMRNLLADFKESVSKKFAYPHTKTEVWLLAKSRKDYWMISPTKMDFLPREGDDFTIGFVRDDLHSGCNFKVESISHELKNGIHEIYIHLDEDLYIESLFNSRLDYQ